MLVRSGLTYVLKWCEGMFNALIHSELAYVLKWCKGMFSA